MIVTVQKRPIPVSAMQWKGDNLAEVLEFTGKHPKWDSWFTSFAEYEQWVKKDRNVFKIITNHGTVEAVPGDWILRSPTGEHYPISDELFQQTYDIFETDVDRRHINEITRLINSVDQNRSKRQHSLAVTKLEEAKHWLQDY